MCSNMILNSWFNVNKKSDNKYLNNKVKYYMGKIKIDSYNDRLPPENILWTSNSVIFVDSMFNS